MANIDLLGSTTRVESPFIKVTINNYTFGVYQKTKAVYKDQEGFYEAAKIMYPNYIKSLQITKINGQVNQYVLNIFYPVTQADDPNFFEKIFSSVSQTRKIIFSYGDANLPTFVYRDEQAIITDIKTNIDIQSSVINYTVSAVSSAALAQSGTYTFLNPYPIKPSDEIKRILYNKTYGLQEIFYGMNNKGLVDQLGLIASDDKVVQIESKTNISILDYLTYLVSCMQPASTSSKNITRDEIYILTIHDIYNSPDNIKTEIADGPYFKITKTNKKVERTDAYEINIGYPEANVVMGFNIDNNENYSILYDWQKKLNPEEQVVRINTDGEEETVYAPIISSRNDTYRTRVSDRTWWTKITEYPISGTITLKGLIRPAILMTHVRLNVWFFGQKHISSGLYIVTKQQDTVDERGYRTVLNLTRISGDSGEE